MLPDTKSKNIKKITSIYKNFELIDSLKKRLATGKYKSDEISDQLIIIETIRRNISVGRFYS